MRNVLKEVHNIARTVFKNNMNINTLNKPKDYYVIKLLHIYKKFTKDVLYIQQVKTLITLIKF